MRIVIDGQVLQSSRLREERYAALRAGLVALVTGWEQHEILVILNGQLPDRILDIRKAFAEFLPAAGIRLWYSSDAGDGIAHAPAFQIKAAQLMREALIASLDADLVVALLEPGAAAADCVFSIGLLHDIPTFVALGSAAPGPTAPSDGVSRSMVQHLAKASRIFAPPGALHHAMDGSADNVTPIGDSDRDLVMALLLATHDMAPKRPQMPTRRPRLAYVSPLPPQRSGISFYSAELIPALSRHYEIDLVVQRIDRGQWSAGHALRDSKWFAANAGSYDRILYHFGNSNFHRHMFALLAAHPGAVVLHDFFLSGVVSDMETSKYAPGQWIRELYHAHGYGPASERFLEKQPVDVIWRYPCSASVLANATGVIVHAESTRALARHWHGPDAERRITVIPHLRAPRPASDRNAARKELGLAAEDFVVCAFGGLGPTKLNHRLVEAWLSSRLSKDPRCTLLFVGTNEGGHYGRALADRIKEAKGHRIRITGWEDEARFQLYLAATDVAVQLRALSRGETSGTVLDCMNGSVPLIVNAHGSMADLPEGTAWMLPDTFGDSALVEAIETLEGDAGKRRAIAERAVDHVRRNNNPDEVAARYAEAIEAFAARPRSSLARLGPALGSVLDGRGRLEREAAAACAALSIQPAFAKRQILVDVSAIVRNDLRTGIERAVRALIRAMIAAPPDGYCIEPIYARGTGFFYARRFTADLLGFRSRKLEDDAIDLRAGDIYFMPDLEHESVIRNRATYQAMRNHGVGVAFMVHDLLPVRLPQFFPPHAAGTHERWLRVVAEADRVVCVSKAVADDFVAWRAASGCIGNPDLRVVHSHHGADLSASKPSTGLPRDAARVLGAIAAQRSFLMVGTVEPRKGHAQVLDAFERIWANGGSEMLVIVGKPGWMLDDFIGRLKRHAERGRRLVWIERASDEYLARLYAACACLIAASHGEGFGLPLIEAAAHGLPIIARDIPVFREVAGEHAFYFDTASADTLADAIGGWLQLDRQGKAPSSKAMPRLSWAESAARLQRLLLGGAL